MEIERLVFHGIIFPIHDLKVNAKPQSQIMMGCSISGEFKVLVGEYIVSIILSVFRKRFLNLHS